MKGLISYRKARNIALVACRDFGIPATRVSKAFLIELEGRVCTFIRQRAIESVADTRKTVGLDRVERPTVVWKEDA